MTEAIKEGSGRYYFSAEVEDIIINGLSGKKTNDTLLLTDREKEIVQLLAREFTNDKIAAQLHISYRTVVNPP